MHNRLIRGASFSAILALWGSASACVLTDPGALRFGGGAVAMEPINGGGQTADGLLNGEFEARDKDGGVLKRGAYVNDVRVGPWVEYHEDATTLKSRYTIVDSKREGLFSSFHRNGRLQAEGQFRSGYEFGTWRFFSARGQRIEEGAFLNGLRTGRWVTYLDDGKPKVDGLWYEGGRVGRWLVTQSDGGPKPIDYPMPAGLEWVAERWSEGGQLRRSGFLESGVKVGLWQTFHRSGEPRATGAFVNGVPSGPWTFVDDEGYVVAEGAMERGRPAGTWKTRVAGALVDTDAATFRSGLPVGGDWSTGDLVQGNPPTVVAATWLEEAMTPAEVAVVSSEEIVEEPTDLSAADESAIEDASAPADVPVSVQPFTPKEQDFFDTFVDYLLGKADRETVSSVYAPTGGAGGGSGQAAEFPEPIGDVERAESYVGKPLPREIFRTEEGEEFNLIEHRGNKVVLVVLRGFGSKICPYCVAQTKAMAEEGAIRKIEQRNAVLEVVYPGTKNGFDAFQRAYSLLTKTDKKAYGMKYEDAWVVAEELRLAGNKVTPSTFILDQFGVVRFAYIGTEAKDRPPLSLLLEELDKID